MAVKSVYNFVPAPKENEIFKPDWAEQVSHDIPFSDGENGEIELKITAKTPIFVRNGHAKTPIFVRNGHAKNQEENEFSYYMDENGEKKYFIPATSLKGMFRNVLEIMSFSRMNQVKGFIDGQFDVFGMRDMNNDEYSKKEIKDVKSGWLQKNGSQWAIQSCTNHRIPLDDIEVKFNLSQKNLKGISGVEKHRICESKLKNKKYTFSFEKNLDKWVGDQYKFDEYGGFEGYVVLYGDIDNKKYDYIFSEGSGKEYTVDHKLVKILDSIESDAADSSLWNYLRKNYDKIPVFFKLGKGSSEVKHFGLSKLYRLNNAHYINQLEPMKGYINEGKDSKPDMAELIFGSIRNNPLKGRVFISHAMAINAIPEPLTERILNSPKPSFYPAYLEQNGENGKLEGQYKTYHDPDAELRGFKRYPAHLDIKPNIESDNENIASEFIPLRKDAFFIGKIRYFNLRPVELGALISAMTFHGNSDKFFHSLGGAKPYGFGKVKIEISNNVEVFDFMKNFEWSMNEHFQKIGKEEFTVQKSIAELLSIASNPKDKLTNSLLKYPLLEVEVNGKKHNEFNDYKKAKKHLEIYSERNGKFEISGIIDEEFNQRLRRKEIKAKKEKEKELQKQKAKEREAFDAASTSNDIVVLKTFVTQFQDSPLKKEAERIIEEIQREDIFAEEERKKAKEAERINRKRKQEKIEAKKMGKEDLKFPSPNFADTKKILKPYFAKNRQFIFSESQKVQIAEQVRKCWKEDREAFYKKKKLANFPKYPWSDIIKWLGRDDAKVLFDELIKNID